jgi:multicomponent Na+:H+ antiporter subunit B
MDIQTIINISLLTLLAITAVILLRLHNLLAAVLLSGIYSLLTAGLFVSLDAVDVAFTEAAVGAGLTTVLLLGAIAVTGREQSATSHSKILPIAVTTITAAALIYGTLDMPKFADPNAPIHTHVAPRYIEKSGEEIGIPNIVTSVLASYRGYDTLGEVTVVFTAAIGVMLLLGGSRKQKSQKVEKKVDKNE